MKNISLLFLIGILFLAGCQYLDGCIVHNAKVSDVYQQAIAYGVLKGYSIKYQDEKNGLISFKIGDFVQSAQTETRTIESQSAQKEHSDDQNHPQTPVDQKIVKDVTKTRVSKTVSTPTMVYERGIAMQFIQTGEDVRVQMNTYGGGYGTAEAEEAIAHFKNKWNVELVYKEQ